jgi:cytochrome c oxidase cbb3-type subunit I
MWNILKLIALGGVTLIAAIGANMAHDAAYMVNALTVMLVAGGVFLWTLRQVDEPAPVHDPRAYMDGPVRAGVVATVLWGVVGFLVGVVIAFQLAWPSLNFSELTHGYLNFGKLRPLHTSAVIFAFGGNALIATSFYVVSGPRRRGSGAGTRPGSSSGATTSSSCWRRPATSSAPRSPRNMPSRNGMSTCG